MDQAHISLHPRVAVIWRGSDLDADQAARYEARLAPVMKALNERGLTPDPIVYFDRDADPVRERLNGASGVLVWVNPIADGQTRETLNALLREAAHQGAFVSAHPDVIDAMGTKQVLFDTRTFSWSADTDLYSDPEDMAERLPAKLAAGEVRVLKPLRGNDGRGVMKLESLSDGRISLQHAHDDQIESLNEARLAERLALLFLQGGDVIDQAFNDNADAGMVRCYMTQNRVAGFARQRPRIKGANAFAMQSAKEMHGPDAPEMADLRELMEKQWTPALQHLFAIETQRLPVLWDADFLLRPQPVSGSRYDLCEINVSCVSPFPEAAPGMLADATAQAIFRMGQANG